MADRCAVFHWQYRCIHDVGHYGDHDVLMDSGDHYTWPVKTPRVDEWSKPPPAFKPTMFSVCVTEDAGIVTWTVVCDRCGRELDVSDPVFVIKVPNITEMAAVDPDGARRYAERLREALASSSREKAMIVDAETTVESHDGGAHHSMLAHARRCGQ